ncbi:type III secretion system export apparatus subunit SctR [Lichenihabitans psoromatis]|uniref:type III secretion system export apparatus subunit SctR n=1 Tax=Lichenihabitans psoromatis TaxID=2528642 RepID=UPI001036BA29|nr:type III secretion system export apparatus subunit SctR [Lichenihabitans psoromatis]
MGEAQPNLLGILIAITALGTLTFVAVTMTSFIKISVILFILRNALGVQQTPPNLVLYGIALLLTGYVMAPVGAKVYAEIAAPGQHYESFSDFGAIASRAEVPAKDFMLRFVSPGEREFFTAAAVRVWGPDSGLTAQPDDLIIVVPAFVLSELRRAFEAGFLIYLPFIAVDLVTTAVLMAMGMSAVSPTTISVPFKLFLFVAIEGWTRLMHGLVLGYAT